MPLGLEGGEYFRRIVLVVERENPRAVRGHHLSQRGKLADGILAEGVDIVARNAEHVMTRTTALVPRMMAVSLSPIGLSRKRTA